MAVSSADNYLYGAGKLYFKTSGDDNYLFLGNAPTFSINMEAEERIEHWESKTNEKLKDIDDIIKWSVSASIILEEYSPDNLNLAFRGDGVQSLGNQSASYIDGAQTVMNDTLHIDLGYTDLSYLKISHGTVTGGPFDNGETVTGGTSSATGVVGWAASGYLELYNISGTFVVGEVLTGGTSTATATSTAVETINGIIACDDTAGSQATRYVEGTDYDLDYIGGLVAAISGGQAETDGGIYVHANYPAKTNQSVRTLAGSQASGELLFVGNPRRGPRWRVQAWNCNVNVSGEINFITEEPGQITLEVMILSDSDTHPSEPYFRATKAS